MNSVRVVVQSKNLVDVKEFQGKRYGWQSAGCFNGGDFPAPFRVNVLEGHEYDPGEYTIAPSSYRTDDMGNLKLKSIKLLPLGGASIAKK